MKMFEPLERRKKVYEEVADEIRERILSHKLNLDERLPSERNMAEQFGISRVAVRESIRILELTGFVVVKNGVKGGVFVAQEYDRPLINSIRNMVRAGEVSVDDMFTVRLLIEPHAAATVAENRSTDGLARLHKTIDIARDAAGKNESLRPLNFRFHRQIVQLSGNAILRAVGETNLTTLVEALSDIPSDLISAQHLAFHRSILDAIDAGDAVTSERLMIEDIQMLRERTLEFIA